MSNPGNGLLRERLAEIQERRENGTTPKSAADVIADAEAARPPPEENPAAPEDDRPQGFKLTRWEAKEAENHALRQALIATQMAALQTEQNQLMAEKHKWADRLIKRLGVAIDVNDYTYDTEKREAYLRQPPMPSSRSYG